MYWHDLQLQITAAHRHQTLLREAVDERLAASARRAVPHAGPTRSGSARLSARDGEREDQLSATAQPRLVGEAA